MRNHFSTIFLFSCFSILPLVGCTSNQNPKMVSNTDLGRVVVYRNGVAYFERTAHIEGETLELSVATDKVNDFLKSLTVTDVRTGLAAPVAYPTQLPTFGTGFVSMKIKMLDPSVRDLKLSYVTESPSWKPSYRVFVGSDGKVNLQGWAIIDNTSGEDWKNVKLGVGSSSALAFRYDLSSIRTVQRETLQPDSLFVLAPPTGDALIQGEFGMANVLSEVSEERLDAELKNYESQAMSSPGVAMKLGSASRTPPQTVVDLKSPKPSGGGTNPFDGLGMDRIVQSAQRSKNAIIIEGFANETDEDKFDASLARANKVRDQLVKKGMSPDQVIAVGKGNVSNRNGGIRIVETIAQKDQTQGQGSGSTLEPQAVEPIGVSHFESLEATSVPRDTSVMVSILKTDTQGEIVYFYDPESSRGNDQFAFQSVRVSNPTSSTLERGPVSVFGEGKFIGEGFTEPVPANSVGFIPFAMDRQIVVEKKESSEDEIEKVLSVQRGVFSSKVQHKKKLIYILNNRLNTEAEVYLKHTIGKGYTLVKGPESFEKLGNSHLFHVSVPALGKLEVTIIEATPVYKSTDIRSPQGLALVRVYLSSAAAAPLKLKVDELIKIQEDIGNIQIKIETTKDQMEEYRSRMDELHVQILTLKAVKSAGPMMQTLEKKAQEMANKLSASTVQIATFQEQLMVTRIKFMDMVSELSVDKKSI